VRAMPLKILYGVELVKQRHAFLRGERVPGADGGMAGHGGERHVQRILKSAFAAAGELAQQIAQEPLRRGPLQQGGDGGHCHCARSEPRADEARGLQLGRVLFDQSRLQLAALDALRKQQPLHTHVALGVAAPQLVEVESTATERFEERELIAA